jgi:hypothetical protein
MEAKMPDGSSLREFFSNEEEMNQRIKEITDAGGNIERVVRVHENTSKHEPHQGKKEIERRRKKLEQLNEAMTDELRRASSKG